jgi:hypothetical protein
VGEYGMAINRRKEGYRAYQNGLPACMNPYGLLSLHDETQEAKDWLEGWYEGEDQDKRLFGIARRADPC